jgi:hypothetical protein
VPQTPKRPPATRTMVIAARVGHEVFLPTIGTAVIGGAGGEQEHGRREKKEVINDAIAEMEWWAAFKKSGKASTRSKRGRAAKIGAAIRNFCTAAQPAFVSIPSCTGGRHNPPNPNRTGILTVPKFSAIAGGCAKHLLAKSLNRCSSAMCRALRCRFFKPGKSPRSTSSYQLPENDNENEYTPEMS